MAFLKEFYTRGPMLNTLISQSDQYVQPAWSVPIVRSLAPADTLCRGADNPIPKGGID